jgi:hypothetical protein
MITGRGILAKESGILTSLGWSDERMQRQGWRAFEKVVVGTDELGKSKGKKQRLKLKSY